MEGLLKEARFRNRLKKGVLVVRWLLLFWGLGGVEKDTSRTRSEAADERVGEAVQEHDEELMSSKSGGGK